MVSTTAVAARAFNSRSPRSTKVGRWPTQALLWVEQEYRGSPCFLLSKVPCIPVSLGEFLDAQTECSGIAARAVERAGMLRLRRILPRTILLCLASQPLPRYISEPSAGSGRGLRIPGTSFWRFLAARSEATCCRSRPDREASSPVCLFHEPLGWVCMAGARDF